MRSLDDLLAEGVSGRRGLLRADLNVPLDKATGQITDDGRIRASLPTISALRDAGARVLVAARLGELLGVDVPLAADVAGPDATSKAAALADGEVLLLENVRFEAAET